MSFKNSIVEEINGKIQVIVNQRNDLQSKLSLVENQVSNLNREIREKESAIEELEQKYKVMKLAKSLEGGEVENNKDLKLKINEMVREIDKCIALLNK